MSQDRIQIENGALTISSVNLSDAGMYQCVAENKHGIIYFGAELVVLGKRAAVPSHFQLSSAFVHFAAPSLQTQNIFTTFHNIAF